MELSLKLQRKRSGTVNGQAKNFNSFFLIILLILLHGIRTVTVMNGQERQAFLWTERSRKCFKKDRFTINILLILLKICNKAYFIINNSPFKYHEHVKLPEKFIYTSGVNLNRLSTNPHRFQPVRVGNKYNFEFWYSGYNPSSFKSLCKKDTVAITGQSHNLNRDKGF